MKATTTYRDPLSLSCSAIVSSSHWIFCFLGQMSLLCAVFDSDCMVTRCIGAFSSFSGIGWWRWAAVSQSFDLTCSHCAGGRMKEGKGWQRSARSWNFEQGQLCSSCSSSPQQQALCCFCWIKEERVRKLPGDHYPGTFGASFLRSSV
jgi:hypothetical protein